MKKIPVLESAQIILEPFSEKHLTSRYVSWVNDPVVCRDNRHGNGDYDLQKAKQYYESVSVSESLHVFAIHLKPAKEHVGNISLCSISQANQSAEIAILIGEQSAWGRGLGYEACRLVLHYAFDTLNLHRVRMGMTTRNQPMIRICEKLGMVYEGTFKDALRKGDIYLDTVQYACLNPKHSERTLTYGR